MPGLPWAAVMLALQAAESLVLMEVIFHDRPRTGLDSGWGLLELYFAAIVSTVVVQSLGILLVWLGRYRAGGVLQIIASAPHVVKLEGLIGIVGGLLAYRYPDVQASEKGSPKRV
jgi:hypothetical protein